MSRFRREIAALDRAMASNPGEWWERSAETRSRAAEIAQETAAVETVEARKRVRASLAERERRIVAQVGALDAKRPFAAARKTKAQQHLEHELRGVRGMLAALDLPTDARDPIINIDLMSHFKRGA